MKAEISHCCIFMCNVLWYTRATSAAKFFLPRLPRGFFVHICTRASRAHTQNAVSAKSDIPPRLRRLLNLKNIHGLCEDCKHTACFSPQHSAQNWRQCEWFFRVKLWNHGPGTQLRVFFQTLYVSNTFLMRFGRTWGWWLMSGVAWAKEKQWIRAVNGKGSGMKVRKRNGGFGSRAREM